MSGIAGYVGSAGGAEGAGEDSAPASSQGHSELGRASSSLLPGCKIASDLLEKFEANRHAEDLDTIDRLINNAEATYIKFRHPDPYIVPWAPGGSKFTRNPAPPQGIEIVYDFGREDND